MASSEPPGNSNPPTETATITTDTGGSDIQVELALNVDKLEDLNKINHLIQTDGIRLLSSDFETKTIRLEVKNKPDGQIGSVQHLQELIEKETGCLAVIKGVGELASAVSELRPSNESVKDGDIRILGVVRLSQLNDNTCYVDGSLGESGHRKEPSSRPHMLSLAIHEYGNLEGGDYRSIGEPIINIAKSDTGDTKISVSKTIPDCNVAEMIGRSIALTRVSQDPSYKGSAIVSAGVVARASTVEQNRKQVCSCSGKTLWEERVDRKRSEHGGGQ